MCANSLRFQNFLASVVTVRTLLDNKCLIHHLNYKGYAWSAGLNGTGTPGRGYVHRHARWRLSTRTLAARWRAGVLACPHFGAWCIGVPAHR